MPKVSNLWYSAEGAGQKISHKIDVSVDSSGNFSAAIPEELVDTARRIKHQESNTPSKDCKWEDVLIDGYRGKLRIVSKQMSRLESFAKAVAHDHVACEMKEEIVILYGTNIDVAYWKERDGALLPNGGWAKDAHSIKNKSGAWADGLRDGHLKRGIHYNVGFIARVVRKITFKRSSGDVIMWSYDTGLENHHGADTSWHAKLNGFTGINVLAGEDYKHYTNSDRTNWDTFHTEIEDGLKEIPFSEEACKFFHDVMIGLCALADRIGGFFKDKKRVEAAIASGAQVLLTRIE